MKAGSTEVLYEGINAGEKDYNALVTKLKERQGVEVVYFGGYHPEAGLIMRQAAEQGYKFQLIMPDSIASPEFWQVAGPAGEGTMFVFPSDPQASPEAKEAGREDQGRRLFAGRLHALLLRRSPGDRPGRRARRLR
jgi:branched-chain amino acid transport system substrate-binding protein